MKIECEVTSVETTGDGLRIGLQGKPATSAEWRPVERQTVTIPGTALAQRTFHVGRSVSLIIKPT